MHEEEILSIKVVKELENDLLEVYIVTSHYGRVVQRRHVLTPDELKEVKERGTV